MPCYDDRNEPKYVIAEAKKDFRHNSDVAEMLCYVLKSLQQVYGADHMKVMLPPETHAWWIEHQERDANKKP